MLLPGALPLDQAVWLMHHGLDCCERQVEAGEVVEFVVAHYPDTTRVAYVHVGHEPVRWLRWAHWRKDPCAGTTLRRVPARNERQRPRDLLGHDE